MNKAELIIKIAELVQEKRWTVVGTSGTKGTEKGMSTAVEIKTGC